MGVLRWAANRYKQLENMGGSHPAVAGGLEITVDMAVVMGLWCLWLLATEGVDSALSFAPFLSIPLVPAAAFLFIDTVVSYLARLRRR